MNRVSENVYFNSYIILHSETTSLPHQGIAKIAELSAVGILRDHILKLPQGEYLPRIVNALTLSFDPQEDVSPMAKKKTGLSTHLLEKLNPFSERTFRMLEDFIDNLPQPVVLISHNGMCFDFPILHFEVQRVGKKFGGHVWCADSLPAFRHLYVGQPRQSFIEAQMKPKNGPLESDLDSMLFESEEFDLDLCKTVDYIEKNYEKTSPLSSPPAKRRCLESQEVDSIDSEETVCSDFIPPTDMRTSNETTPKKQLGMFAPKVAQVWHATNQSKSPSPGKVVGVSIQKPLQKEPVRSLMKAFNSSHFDRPKCFSLADVYEYACQRAPMDAGSASSHTSMLLQSIVSLRNGFLPWVDKNAIPFNRKFSSV